jgi:hypothetical protein
MATGRFLSRITTSSPHLTLERESRSITVRAIWSKYETDIDRMCKVPRLGLPGIRWPVNINKIQRKLASHETQTPAFVSR